MTTHFPTRLLHPTPLRVASVTLCLMLGGCTVVGDWFSHGDTNYKGASKRTQPLEVPPDLTQLQKDSRYLPQGGVVAASDLSKPADGTAGAAATQPGLAPAPANPQVALAAAGNLHLERNGDQRWLTTQDAPENVLPKVRAYWLSQGYTLTTDEPKTGILETDWKESRDKLPSEGIRGILSNLVGNLSDSGLRDRYRTRLERRPDGGTDIFVTHFGAIEQATGTSTSVQTADVQWLPRKSDPGLEATQLSQMMLSLAGVTDTNVAVAKHSIFHFGEDDDAAASAPAGTRPIPSAATSRPTVGGTGPNGAARASSADSLGPRWRSRTASTAPGVASASRWIMVASPSKTATARKGCTTCAMSMRRRPHARSRASSRRSRPGSARATPRPWASTASRSRRPATPPPSRCSTTRVSPTTARTRSAS